MAVSPATISGRRDQRVGSLKQTVRRITFDSSYVTGGEPVTAAQVGLHQVKDCRAILVSGFASGFAHVDPLIQTDGSLLLRLRTAAGAEVASTTNASTVVVDLVCLGY